MMEPQPARRLGRPVVGTRTKHTVRAEARGRGPSELGVRARTWRRRRPPRSSVGRRTPARLLHQAPMLMSGPEGIGDDANHNGFRALRLRSRQANSPAAKLAFDSRLRG